MKIHNVRLGSATNSSSSHSIIFDPSLKNVSDDYDVEEDFGWNYFTLASKEAKDDYITAMLVQNLSHEDAFTTDITQLILKGLGLNLNEETKKELDLYGYCSGIDHQSLYILPKEHGTNCVSIQFFKEFREYLLKEGIIILGGNDNNDKDHPLWSEDHQLTLDEYKPDDEGWVCRKDGQWWTLYNKASGNRAVFSFEDNPESFKPETPMLIDFKISNFCDIGCQFCVPADTVISGQGKIVNVLAGESVVVLNHLSNELEHLPVAEKYVQKFGEELIVIETDEHILKLTPEHEVYTANRGYIQAKNLTENDVLS